MRKSVLVIGCIAALCVIGAILANISGAPALRDQNGKKTPKTEQTIVELLPIHVNGSKQWISIRGMDRAAPVLLFIHGGPGSPEMTMMREYFGGGLERSFVVVGWDQRGAAKSFNAAKGTALTIDSTIEDARAVIDYLRARFGKEKVFVVGHSWGSLVGTLLTSKYPDRIAGYCGVGQLVYGIDNEKVSYAWALERAKERGDAKGIKALESIAVYGENPAEPDRLKHLMIERKWLNAYGGATGHDPSFLGHMLGNVLLAPEYTFMDKVNYMRGNMGSLKAMWDSVLEHDLGKEVPRLEVPVMFAAGRYDYNVPSPLAESYFQTLEAPRKRFVWFENSAHSPCFEEPVKFSEELTAFFLENE
jgi:pimeloyl-ACP methyl ester carboxylesterase